MLMVHHHCLPATGGVNVQLVDVASVVQVYLC